MRKDPKTAAAEDAATLAAQALNFLAEDQQRIGRFFQLTGLTPEGIAGELEKPGFFLAVLEHLLSDEPLLLMFCANFGVEPGRIAEAHRALDGELSGRRDPAGR